MALDYGYGEKCNELISLLQTYPPDFERANQLIASGVNINAISEQDTEESVLSEVILGYPCSDVLDDACGCCDRSDCNGCEYLPLKTEMDGKYLPAIITLFLDSGFNLTRDDGRVGGRCLLNLTWSSYDRYILDATKLLLHAGVDPEGDPDNEGTIMSWVATKEGAADCIEHDHALSNLFYTMYEIMDAAKRGDDYDSIELYEKICGRKIDGVVLYSGADRTQGLFPCSTEYGNYENCFRDNLVIWCEGVPLCIDQYESEIIDPRIPQRAKSSNDITRLFSDCIGARIVDFSFDYNEIAEGATCYGQPITHIRLDNGNTIRFRTNHGEAAAEDDFCHFMIIKKNG